MRSLSVFLLITFFSSGPLFALTNESINQDIKTSCYFESTNLLQRVKRYCAGVVAAFLNPHKKCADLLHFMQDKGDAIRECQVVRGAVGIIKDGCLNLDHHKSRLRCRGIKRFLNQHASCQDLPSKEKHVCLGLKRAISSSKKSCFQKAERDQRINYNCQAYALSNFEGRHRNYVFKFLEESGFVYDGIYEGVGDRERVRGKGVLPDDTAEVSPSQGDDQFQIDERRFYRPTDRQ